MSGGFFRGTSADQDTRFSNKQAKLLKSQKFAPELENLVDITKVKMDVMRPWIAHRVTELLGFEDEVLINFIYGLLEGKVVNGKEIQISLTGFMEKNTGKFMKELWTLLLSAQKNASGVPQQFLDAKEEETRKKKAEADRITNEIQKKKEKEGRELELERMKKMDVEVDISRANDAAVDRSLRQHPRGSNTRPVDEETNGRNGSRGRSRVSRSPRSTERTSSPPRRRPSRSVSKSVSNSRSHSNERHRSRSVSVSPRPRRRSISSEKVLTSPRRRSVTPSSPRRSLSPRRRPNYRRRSISRTRQRSPSPVRRRFRSPMRRRSRSPIQRWSRSPMRRRSRSPIVRRSRSPFRRRSRPPIRYRSRSPVRRRSRSPIRPRSPSPGRRRSPSPVRRRYRRSPSTPPRRTSGSPVRRRPTVPSRRRSPTPPRRRSPSPQEWSSQSPPPRRTPPSPVRRSPKRQRRSPVQSPRDRNRTLEKRSPVRRAPPRDVQSLVETRKGSDSLVRRTPVSLRSPQRDAGDRNDSRSKLPALSPSPYKSPSVSESPPADRKRSLSEDRRSVSPYESPVKQIRERIIDDGSASPPRKSRERKPIHHTPQKSVEDEETSHARDEALKFKPSGKRSVRSSTTGVHKDSAEKVLNKDKYSPEKLTSHRSGETRVRRDNVDLRKRDQETKSETISGRARFPEVPPTSLKGTLSSERVHEPYLGEGHKGDERSRSRPNDVKGTDKLPRKVERNEQIVSMDSGSEESDGHRAEINEKRKPRMSKRSEVTSDEDYSDDSQIEGRKEAKKRRKEEKRLKKEERRRRREERRRRREERRLEKLKRKTAGTIAPPLDLEKNHDGYASDGERVSRRDSHSSDIEETETKQKKLEIELREKALESLRAKKGVGN